MKEISQYDAAPFSYYDLRMFKESPGYHVEAEGEAEPEKSPDSEKGVYVFCKFCRNIISSKQEIIDINGSQFHVFKNPAGIIYHIVCFNRACGCLPMGEPTDEYSWFPGCLWCYALCSKCLNHLGWYYRSRGGGFFGLILDNITENN